MELNLSNETMELTDEMEREKNKEESLLEIQKNNNFQELGVEKTIQDVTKSFEKNIENEVGKIDVSAPIWEKISQSKLKDIVKFAIETTLKVVLKKKFHINFSSFDDMKKAVESAMDGNLKQAVKSASDAVINNITQVDTVTKNAIKSVKNHVIDTTIDSQRYEIINKQTKLVNRIGKNCDELNQAFHVNDATLIKKKANAIQKDMKEILPIQDTIHQAQIMLDKYELWKNNGNQMLSFEENELIEKLNKTA